MTAKFRKVFRQSVSIVCSLALVPAGSLLIAQQPAPPAQNAPAPLLSPEQLDNLVAPVALYPDSLLSQVLVASTYPLEVAEAAQWLARNRNLQGQQLVDAARQQNWDASIQALVVFPDVLNRLNSDIRWTTDLGNAFLAQQADVMNAVQRMRAQAQQAGKLSSNAQQIVTTDNQDGRTVIEIQPADPAVVYVPYYDPAYIWGPPVWGYYPPLYYPAFGFGYWPGVSIGFFFGGLGWGGWGWGPNWFSCSIYQRPYFFNHYGFGRFYGGGYYGGGYYGGGNYGGGFRGGNWVHDPVHRLGVPYGNSNVASRFGGYSRGGFNGGRFAGVQRYTTPQQPSFGQPNRGGSFGGRGGFGSVGSRPGVTPQSRGFAPSGTTRPQINNPPASGWRRFGRPGAASGPVEGQVRGGTALPGRSYGGGSSRPAPSYSYNYGGNRVAPSDRPAPSFGGGGAYRSAPSYNYGGNRGVPSYRSAPSFGGGGSRGSFGGGGGTRSFGGGGGGSRGGGGASRGGGSHGGGRR